MTSYAPTRPDGVGRFILNGEHRVMASRVVDYDELSNLANIDPARNPTIVYRRATGPKPDGSLVRGQTVETGEGTAIDCVITGSAWDVVRAAKSPRPASRNTG